MTTLEQTTADDQWLAALAGRALDGAPSLLSAKEAKQAAELRQFFMKRDADEAAQRVSPQSLARLQAKLARPGVMAAIAAAHTANPTELGQTSLMQTIFNAPLALLNWLLPPSGNNTGRYAAVTFAVTAVLVAPTLLHQSGTTDDHASVKSLPKSLQKGGPSQAIEQLVLAQNPAQTATQIQQALAAAGVVATVLSSGADAVVSASVPSTSAAAVQLQLKPWGQALPASGQLQIRIARSQ